MKIRVWLSYNLGVKGDYSSLVDLKKTDRVYLVFMNDDNKYIGSFINGKRKASPWEGCSLEFSMDDE